MSDSDRFLTLFPNFKFWLLFNNSPPEFRGIDEWAHTVPTITLLLFPSSFNAPPFIGSLIIFFNKTDADPPYIFLWKEGIRACESIATYFELGIYII